MTKPLYFWNGTTFELVGPTTPQSPFAYQTSAPTAPATGDIWIDSDGDVDTYNRQLTRYYFVATAGQTSVSGTDANGLTLAYVAGSEAVYVNGALQVRGVDYTATNGTSITGLSALALNDVVEVFAYTAFTVANAYTKSETDSLISAAPGLQLIVPSSISVGSGTGSVSTTGTITLSAVSSVSINNCFSATYDNYKIMLNVSGSGFQTGSIRLRTSSDDSNAVYDYAGQYQSSGSSVWQNVGSGASQTSWLGFMYGTNGLQQNIFEIGNPFTTNRTLFSGVTHEPGASSLTVWRSGQFRNTTSFTGISFINSGSTTFTGTIQVYGYKE